MATTASYFLSWGLMSIPVKSYVAARDVKFSFTNLHADCAAQGKPANLTRKTLCAGCLGEVTAETTVKGYELDKQKYVIVTEEELDGLEPEKSKGMEIKAFVPVKDVDPVWLGASNFLGPTDQATAKAYYLLKQALEKTGRAAIVQYVGSGRDKVALIRATKDALMMHELFYANEVRSFETQNRVQVKLPALSKQELDLAVELVKEDESPFDMTAFEDGYQTRVGELIQIRMAGGTVPKLEPRAPAHAELDVMVALQKTMAAKKAAKKAAPAGKRKAA